MTLLTLGKYLIGDRQAILQIAGSRQALWLGLVFVLAAGFAREYDGEDLLHEPWHVLLPLGASLASSAVLYLLVRLVAWLRGTHEPGFVNGYLDFLGLYWLTAPLALVYAIPVERFLSPGDAMRVNLSMLALVALWRVLLMARVVSVLYECNFFGALWIVMLFGDSVALAVLRLTPLPILTVMGGIRLAESEELLLMTAILIATLGMFSLPVWVIGTAVVAFFPKGTRWAYQPTTIAPLRIGLDLRIFAACTLGIWVLVLPLTQSAQQRRWLVERSLHEGRVAEGLNLMSKYELSDFPLHWDPPPRVSFGERVPEITAVQEQLRGISVKPWIRTIYARKFGNSLRGENDFTGVWWELTPQEVERRLALIEEMPERDEIIRDHVHGLRHLVGEDRFPVELQERIKKLLVQAGIPRSEIPPYGEQTE